MRRASVVRGHQSSTLRPLGGAGTGAHPLLPGSWKRAAGSLPQCWPRLLLDLQALPFLLPPPGFGLGSSHHRQMSPIQERPRRASDSPIRDTFAKLEKGVELMK